MELFFFRHAEYERLYNCTGLDIDSIPLERRQFVPESIAICVLCAIYYVLYVPCIYSIWKHMRDNSCYKLLFYIGIIDLGVLWIIGFFSGWANLRGAVFCSFPTPMYFVGIAGLALWCAESSADLVLAFNRCLDLVSPRFSHILFSGPRTSLWITGCSLYALYWALFMKPGVYSSIYFGWFFYPFVGYRTGPRTSLWITGCSLYALYWALFMKPGVYSSIYFGMFFYPFVGYRTGDDQHKYEQWQHSVHNTVVAFLSPLIYLIFAAKLFYDVRKNRRQSGVDVSVMGAAQIRIFTQVFLVSLMNTLTGFLYVYMQSNEVHQWMNTLAEFACVTVAATLPKLLYFDPKESAR
uniref:G_PROTEIN_RECEP_F1_2 domain-containing protein n=1 Tax=Globodera pallida TaxID=36090 RepID=A0A183BK06_GLOPA